MWGLQHVRVRLVRLEAAASVGAVADSGIRSCDGNVTIGKGGVETTQIKAPSREG